MDDNASHVSWSAASDTDRMLFTVLSNTERLDMDRLPRLPVTSAGSPRVEEVLTTVPEGNEDAARDLHPTGPSCDDPDMDALRRYEHEHTREGTQQCTDECTPLDNTQRRDNQSQYNETLPRPPQTSHNESMNASRVLPLSFDELDPPRDEQQPPPRDEQQPPPRDEIPNTNSPHVHESGRGGDGRVEHTAPPIDPEALQREHILEKQSTLYDLHQLETRGVRLSRRWTMDDPLDDMTHELRHHLLVLDERENVGMMKNGMKMALTGIEILNTRMNLLDLEGWSAQAASELDRQDGNLARIYRKYWRRSTSSNPETDILFSLVSSMGMYHMKRSMARHMMTRNARPPAHTRRRSATYDSSDDEQPPHAR